MPDRLGFTEGLFADSSFGKTDEGNDEHRTVLEFDEKWDRGPDEDPSPFEPKASDWGWYNGRLVALDYSVPAWSNLE